MNYRSASHDHVRLGRRAFLKNGSLVLTAATLTSGTLLADESASTLRVGLVTDLHSLLHASRHGRRDGSREQWLLGDEPLQRRDNQHRGLPQTRGLQLGVRVNTFFADDGGKVGGDA